MKLSDYLITQELSPAEFARRIEVGRMSVHRYISGERFPRPEVLARIHQETSGQVTPNDFLAQAHDEIEALGKPAADANAHEVSLLPPTDQCDTDNGELIGRPLYPWSRLTADEQQVLDDAYDDMMDEPPEGSGLSPVVQEALETLGDRASYSKDLFKLDGQVTRIINLIDAANQPVTTVDHFPLRAAVWDNVTREGEVFYSVTFERAYKKDGKWNSSSNFNRSDLLALSKLANEVDTKIREMVEASRNQENSTEAAA
eukprot:g15149.t1